MFLSGINISVFSNGDVEDIPAEAEKGRKTIGKAKGMFSIILYYNKVK